MDLKENLEALRVRFAELHDAADKLENKNFRDIAAQAKRRLDQLAEHPDLAKVVEAMTEHKDEAGEKGPFGDKKD